MGTGDTRGGTLISHSVFTKISHVKNQKSAMQQRIAVSMQHKVGNISFFGEQKKKTKKGKGKGRKRGRKEKGKDE